MSNFSMNIITYKCYSGLYLYYDDYDDDCIITDSLLSSMMSSVNNKKIVVKIKNGQFLA